MKAEETAGAVAEPETETKTEKKTPPAAKASAPVEKLGAIEGGEYKDLDLADLVESPTNPRKHYDAEKMKEFAENIRTTGVLQPIVCRRIKPDRPGATGKIEVILGSRRVRASKLAGKKTIPARIVDISDLAAAEAQLIENLMRQDPHPMEEAIGYQELIEKHKRTVQQIAARIGKSISYIHMTLVLTRLAPAVRDMYVAGVWGKDGDEGSFTKNHAQMLARLQPDAQKLAFEQFRWDGAPSTRDLADWIQRDVYMNLDKAPWKLDDATLQPKAGACDTCPKLSGNSPFFSDLKHKTCCTDRVCFDAKQAAQLDRAKFEAAKKLAQRQAEERAEATKGLVGINGGVVVPPGEKQITAAAKEVLEVSGTYSSDKKTLGKDHWVKAKVACPDPKPAVVVVEGYDRRDRKIGQQLDVCINKKCKSCWSKEDAQVDASAQRYKAEEKRRKAKNQAEGERRAGLFKAIMANVTAPLPREVTNAALLAFFNSQHHDTRARLVKVFNWDCVAQYEEMTKAAKTFLEAATTHGLAQFMVAMTLSHELGVNQYSDQKAEQMEAWAKLFKAKPAKVSPPIKGGNTPAPKKTNPKAAAKPAKKAKPKKKK